MDFATEPDAEVGLEVKAPSLASVLAWCGESIPAEAEGVRDGRPQALTSRQIPGAGTHTAGLAWRRSTRRGPPGDLMYTCPDSMTAPASGDWNVDIQSNGPKPHIGLREAHIGSTSMFDEYQNSHLSTSKTPAKTVTV